MKNHMPSTAKIIVVAAFSMLAVVSLFAQEKSLIEQVYELNRTGKWEAAARKAKEILDSNQAQSGTEECEIYQSLIYL